MGASASRCGGPLLGQRLSLRLHSRGAGRERKFRLRRADHELRGKNLPRRVARAPDARHQRDPPGRELTSQPDPRPRGCWGAANIASFNPDLWIQ